MRQFHPELIESELFGHVKVHLQVIKDKQGKFELANGGTIFLRRIDDMSLVAQAKKFFVRFRKAEFHL